MNAASRKIALCIGLGVAFAAAPTFAQDSMQGMDMSHTPHPAKKTAKHEATKPSKAVAEPQPPKTKSSASSMPGMTMHPQHPSSHKQQTDATPNMKMPSGSGMPMQPPPYVTGKLQTLRIGSDIGVRPAVRGLNLELMQMDMQGMPMQGGQAPPDARSADYSDGIGYGTMPGLHMLDDAALGMLLIDHLELFDGRSGDGVALDAHGWYGTDANKVWFKAEGETGAGRVQDLRTEALISAVCAKVGTESWRGRPFEALGLIDRPRARSPRQNLPHDARTVA